MQARFDSNCPYQRPFQLPMGQIHDTEVADIYFEFLGYPHHDVVATAEASAEQRAEFFRWHLHEADEVRRCVGGTGDFSFWTGHGILTLTLDPGDYLVIPSRTVHRYQGLGTFFRYFKDDLGWTPIYVDITT